MNVIYDLGQITLSLKPDEKLIAFTGFSIFQNRQPVGEGILKISSFQNMFITRADWSGHLTLTFIIDTDPVPEIRGNLATIFENITESTIRRFFTDTFETVSRCPMNAASKSGKWYFEEINIYFKTLKDKEPAIIEQHVIPALETILPFRFDPIEWWDHAPSKHQNASELETPRAAGSLKNAILDWFRSL